MPKGWAGDRVRLVPVNREEHFQNWIKCYQDPEISEWLNRGDLPVTIPGEEEFFDSVVLKPGHQPRNINFAVELLSGHQIGHTMLTDIDWPNQVARTGMMLFHQNFHGKGYGTQAGQIRSWYAFHVLGFRLLTSGNIAGNVKSERMQAKLGYVQTGRVPGLRWSRGEYRDVVTTVLTRERWLELSNGQMVW